MDHQVTVTDQRPIGLDAYHSHIVAIGTGGTADRPEYIWTLAQVLAAIRSRKTRFYTYGPYSQQSAWVIEAGCVRCGTAHIKSAPDAVKDNNLDSLPVRKLI